MRWVLSMVDRDAVVNENEVRAAAGLTMVVGAVAFSYAYFAKQYLPLQVVATVFFLEFLARLTIGLRSSPVGVVARAMTLGRPPDWVSAKPKRFAWTLGLGMTFAMTIITNSGIRGLLPRTICLICLTLMWLESTLGVCLGCELHGLLVRRGRSPALCTDGSCGPASAAICSCASSEGRSGRPRPSRGHARWNPLLRGRAAPGRALRAEPAEPASGQGRGAQVAQAERRAARPAAAAPAGRRPRAGR
jgi:hypothetical protein